MHTIRSLLAVFLSVILLSACGKHKTTAERFAELLNEINDYPVCNNEGCIEEITAKNNRVIATYIINRNSSSFPKSVFVNRSETAERLKVSALRDFCGALQKDFPDPNMEWVGHYYTNDGKFLASILMRVSECP